MKIINSAPNVLKDNLDSAIQEVVSDFRRNYRIDNYNPDFSRQRVLTMEMVINLLLSMQGGSLKKELYDAGISATASAFVQQRNKIPWTVMEEIFEKFNPIGQLCNKQQYTKGI